ncbi:MAG: hypothetical protein K5930_01375 [Treponemataceae bacterium]|nr:hypothetical protein [Treponemataceae bacterium]
MTITEIKVITKKYHLSELCGIASSLILMLLSLIPIFQGGNIYQMSVILFFFMMFALRLWLFLWNRRVSGRAGEQKAQAKMMLVSAIILLLMHSQILLAVLYQLLVSDKIPVMASLQVLAIVYGTYAVGKLILSVRSYSVKRRMNKYAETLSYLGLLNAMYTLSLFTNYLLLARKAVEYNWPRYIMISLVGIMSFLLAIIMLVKAVKELRV